MGHEPGQSPGPHMTNKHCQKCLLSIKPGDTLSTSRDGSKTNKNQNHISLFMWVILVDMCINYLHLSSNYTFALEF